MINVMYLIEMNIHSNIGKYLYIAQSTLVNTLGSVCTIQYYTVLYSTIQYYTVIYSTIQYYTVLYSTIQHYTVLYSTIQYYAVLYISVDSLNSTIYNTQCNIHSTQFTIYSVQFTICTVHNAYCTYCHSWAKDLLTVEICNKNGTFHWAMESAVVLDHFLGALMTSTPSEEKEELMASKSTYSGMMCFCLNCSPCPEASIVSS